VVSSCGFVGVEDLVLLAQQPPYSFISAPPPGPKRRCNPRDRSLTSHHRCCNLTDGPELSSRVPFFLCASIASAMALSARCWRHQWLKEMHFPHYEPGQHATSTLLDQQMHKVWYLRTQFIVLAKCILLRIPDLSRYFVLHQRTCSPACLYLRQKRAFLSCFPLHFQQNRLAASLLSILRRLH
jgi:hypothetical protein